MERSGGYWEKKKGIAAHSLLAVPVGHQVCEPSWTLQSSSLQLSTLQAAEESPCQVLSEFPIHKIVRYKKVVVALNLLVLG